MDRRGFFVNSALVGAAAALTGNEAKAQTGSQDQDTSPIPVVPESDLSGIPIFCAHEHWGSINALGMDENGFRSDTQAAAEPVRDTSVWDIVFDPYFGGWMFAGGYDAHKEALDRGCESLLDWWNKEPAQVLASIESPLRAQHYTGAFQCIRQGILSLHGVDLVDMQPAPWQQADTAIRTQYASLFGWYQHAMKQLNVSELIRPVHPEYFLDAGPRADAERAFMRPILRIDPLLELWPEACPRRDRLAAALGVEPRDAKSWRAFISALFDLAATQGNVGIKQLQAYSRPLDFAYRKDGEVTFSGALNNEEKTAFQDWVVHECCKQAHERDWPHQVHTGTHNLKESSPLPLASLANRYPRMKIVLLHCWPFIEESGFLAKHTHNIYLDACWQTILNPAYLKQSLAQWLGYIPATKLMCSQDATSIEMAAGSIAITRHLLNQALTEQGNLMQLPESSRCAYAADILNNNAVAVYGVGKPCRPC